MDASRSQNTQAVYRQAQESFSKFLAIHFPGEYASFSFEQVALFISYLSLQGYAASTICANIMLLGYHSICVLRDSQMWLLKHFVVSRLLDGCRRRRSRVDTRCSIIMSLLEKLLPCLTRVCTSYDAVLFKACFTVAFFAFLRSANSPVSHGQWLHEDSLRASDMVVSGRSPRRNLRLFIFDLPKQTSWRGVATS